MLIEQKAKVAMSDAQLLHAERQARGEEAYQGKLLEARQSDYKDEVFLVILTFRPHHWCSHVGSDVGRSGSDGEDKMFFDHFQAAPIMVH
jgi:hypothetical protein